MEQNIDIQEQKRYINQLESDIRKNELEEICLQEQLVHLNKQKEDARSSLSDQGFTPDSVDEGLQNLKKSIINLRSKLDSLLALKKKEETSDEPGRMISSEISMKFGEFKKTW